MRPQVALVSVEHPERGPTAWNWCPLYLSYRWYIGRWREREGGVVRTNKRRSIRKFGVKREGGGGVEFLAKFGRLFALIKKGGFRIERKA